MKIGGNDYPVYFSWLAIENISAAQSHNSLDVTASNLNTLVNTLKFARVVIFEGVKAGCLKEGIECPFKTSEDVANAITKFSDATAIMEEYTKAVADFYTPVEEDKKKGEQENP
jgi:hypothetical protein